MKLLPHEKAYIKTLITHSPDKCQGRACCIHSPSAHHMRKWPMNYRFDKGVMERLCECGIGHPDPDDAAYQESVGRGYLNTHGCCGCCAPPKKPEVMEEPHEDATAEVMEKLNEAVAHAWNQRAQIIPESWKPVVKCSKIIQIMMTPNDAYWQGRIIGLADDGTVYHSCDEKWEVLIPSIHSQTL